MPYLLQKIEWGAILFRSLLEVLEVGIENPLVHIRYMPETSHLYTRYLQLANEGND